MKAISLHQPYASLIAFGFKTIETRRWPASYRGDILICASKNPKFDRLPTGTALAIAEIADCRPMTVEDERAACCPLYDGAWSWRLANVRPIEPLPVRGRQRIFTVDIDPADIREPTTRIFYPHYCYSCHRTDVRKEPLTHCRFCGSDNTTNCYGEHPRKVIDSPDGDQLRPSESRLKDLRDLLDWERQSQARLAAARAAADHCRTGDNVKFKVDTTRPPLAPPNRTTDHDGAVETAESKARGRAYERYLAAYKAARQKNGNNNDRGEAIGTDWFRGDAGRFGPPRQIAGARIPPAETRRRH